MQKSAASILGIRDHNLQSVQGLSVKVLSFEFMPEPTDRWCRRDSMKNEKVYARERLCTSCPGFRFETYDVISYAASRYIARGLEKTAAVRKRMPQFLNLWS